VELKVVTGGRVQCDEVLHSLFSALRLHHLYNTRPPAEHCAVNGRVSGCPAARWP
jgi:hypothetical protein